MKKFRTVLCILLAVAMVLSFAACGKKTDDKATNDDAADNTPAGDNTPADDNAPADDSTTPDDGDELVDTSVALQDTIITSMDEYNNRPEGIQPGTEIKYVMLNDTPSYVPWNDTSAAHVYTQIFDGLLYNHLGAVDDIRGNIAETWEHSDDYLTWTFHLRDDVKFTDGTDCDAYAFETSWNYYKERSSTNITNFNIESWEAVDATTFVVHLSAPCAFFENGMAGTNLVPLSPTACELYGADNNGCAVGCGPYMVDSYTPGVGMDLKANPNYHLNEKRPHIETVHYIVIKDSNTLMMALLNGEVDGAVSSDIELYYNLQDNGFDGDLRVSLSNVNPVYLNAKKVEAFQTFEVREALARFVDFEAVNDLLYDGHALVQTSLWAYGTSGYVPTDDYYYNPDEGYELLESVGMTTADINFTVTCQEGADTMFVALQNQLSKVGIEFDIEIIEAAANFTLLKNGDWTATVGSNAYTNAAPYAPWNYILKKDAMIKQIWTDIYNPELYDQMIQEYEAMTTSATWEEMIEHCHQLTTYAQDDHAALLGLQRPGFIVLNGKYKNAIYYTATQYIMLYYLYV